MAGDLVESEGLLQRVNEQPTSLMTALVYVNVAIPPKTRALLKKDEATMTKLKRLGEREYSNEKDG
jgi:hypothetical protein